MRVKIWNIPICWKKTTYLAVKHYSHFSVISRQYYNYIIISLEFRRKISTLFIKQALTSWRRRVRVRISVSGRGSAVHVRLRPRVGRSLSGGGGVAPKTLRFPVLGRQALDSSDSRRGDGRRDVRAHAFTRTFYSRGKRASETTDKCKSETERWDTDFGGERHGAQHTVGTTIQHVDSLPATESRPGIQHTRTARHTHTRDPPPPPPLPTTEPRGLLYI